MKIFKFGGASVKDAEGVKNVLNVLKHEGFKNTLIVISAMGKTTNAFEKIIDSYYNKSSDLEQHLEDVRKFHLEIISNLFEIKNHPIYMEVEQLLGKLGGFLIDNKSTNYNFIYDQIVGYGELLSTKIVSAYLNDHKLNANWIDVRDYIKTDSSYRDAKIDWEQTSVKISKINTEQLYITQGFIGSNSNQKTTSLGREGSDFTAAIFAYCLNAQSVTIWKDVVGVLNADPRFFKTTELLQQISYSEAIEMAFYGASVIHPKTLKPLENKNIPLYVRSFYSLTKNGTTVGKGHSLIPEVPCFILKQHQILISIAALDFSFMVESNLSDIFKILHNYKLKVNLIQNSALSFSVCIEDNYHNFQQFLNEMKLKYNLNYTENVSLYTIRHATQESVQEIEQKGRILLKQATKGTVQLVMQ
ncbi:MAG: aspartate kinase [Lutibacter sp.]|uniref:aspartate kinase n=1 Tax=Lutibacter sp. TaxID=1925666 RepID=UPI00178F5729|nr:aspartate kinase [Lutibacter sp.]MBT8318214.1 aspartate kinase [Lutibacter sp.]NNJ59074.1 aspartate kinase [Lutibacter sp.]